MITISYFQFGSPLGFADVIQIQSDVADIPEPSTWMMALSGLGVLRYALRRRKSA